MKQVLVLNQDFRAVSVCSVERAFVLLYLHKAETVKDYENMFLHTVSSAYPFPSIIKLNKYVQFNRKKIPLNRQNILKRDNGCCQYCGKKTELTLDHVFPKSRGGKTEWTNLVAACIKCNSKKGDRTPEEAGMVLKKKPVKPSYLSFLQKFNDHENNLANYLN